MRILWAFFCNLYVLGALFVVAEVEDFVFKFTVFSKSVGLAVYDLKTFACESQSFLFTFGMNEVYPSILCL